MSPMKFDTLDLVNVPVTAQQRLPLHSLHDLKQAYPFVANHAQLTQYTDEMTRALVTQLRTYLAALEDERIRIHRQYPADWWQALKDRWFPHWLRKRFPVRYERIDIDEPRYKAICPHIAHQTPDDREHFRWLLEQQES